MLTAENTEDTEFSKINRLLKLLWESAVCGHKPECLLAKARSLVASSVFLCGQKCQIVYAQVWRL